MGKLNIEDIASYLKDDNILGTGKEVNVYNYNDKVIKIFHKERQSQLERLSDLGLIKLSSLDLTYFNKPIDIIYDNEDIIGYTEKKLTEEELNLDEIDFDGIKNDIITLSENGFTIQDLYYNYIFSNNNLYFIDLTSYKYIDTKEPFLKNFILKNNIKEVNIFLIGLIHFDAFKIKGVNEYTKIFLANEYRNNNLKDNYYGDMIEKLNKKR